jgi:hypothetical protein
MFRTATALSLLLGLYVAAPEQAHATDVNLTCTMTSAKNGSTVVYRFFAGSDPVYVREISVSRDGVQLTPNRSYDAMPKWTATIDNAARKAEFWSEADPGWSLVSYATPGSMNSQATVYTPSGKVSSTGVCLTEVLTVSQPVVAQPSVSSTPSYSSNDSMPISVEDNSIFADAIMGGRSIKVMVDTGSNIGTIPSTFANTLVTNGEATRGEIIHSNMANGADQTMDTVVINAITFGGHTIHNVPFGVGNDTVMPLFDYDALSLINHKVTIDRDRGVLTFG